MPRYVDAEQRVNDIVDASVQILSESGFAKLTLKNIAKELGGSITLVTHYFANREALIAAILDRVLSDADSFIAGLSLIASPEDRLRALLEWFLPLDERSLAQERARIALVAYRDAEPSIRAFLDKLEPAMRSAIRSAIEGKIPGSELEVTIDLIRVWTSGVALAAVEHPEIWSPTRQLAAMNELMGRLELPVRLTEAR